MRLSVCLFKRQTDSCCLSHGCLIQALPYHMIPIINRVELSQCSVVVLYAVSVHGGAKELLAWFHSTDHLAVITHVKLSAIPP